MSRILSLPPLFGPPIPEEGERRVLLRAYFAAHTRARDATDAIASAADGPAKTRAQALLVDLMAKIRELHPYIDSAIVAARREGQWDPSWPPTAYQLTAAALEPERPGLGALPALVIAAIVGVLSAYLLVGVFYVGAQAVIAVAKDLGDAMRELVVRGGIPLFFITAAFALLFGFTRRRRASP